MSAPTTALTPAMLRFEVARLRAALQVILDSRPEVVCDVNKKVNDPDNIGWNVHMIARDALNAGTR